MIENKTNKAEKRWFLRLDVTGHCKQFQTASGAYVTAADTPEGWATIIGRAERLIDDAHEAAVDAIIDQAGYTTEELDVLPYGTVLRDRTFTHEFCIDTPDGIESYTVTIAVTEE